MAVALVAAAIMVGVSGAFATVGDITTFTDPAGNVSQPEDITTGPDGALWFAEKTGRAGPRPPCASSRTIAGAAWSCSDGTGDIAGPTSPAAST